MPTLRIKMLHRRPRTPGRARSPRTGPTVQAQSPPPVPHLGTLTPPADATWQAIVEQLLATPSEREPYKALRANECAWARSLGMHINRLPRR